LELNPRSDPWEEGGELVSVVRGWSSVSRRDRPQPMRQTESRQSSDLLRSKIRWLSLEDLYSWGSHPDSLSTLQVAWGASIKIPPVDLAGCCLCIEHRGRPIPWSTSSSVRSWWFVQVLVSNRRPGWIVVDWTWSISLQQLSTIFASHFCANLNTPV